MVNKVEQRQADNPLDGDAKAAMEPRKAEEAAVDLARQQSRGLAARAVDITPEQEPLDERLRALVVEPIDALPTDRRTVEGKVRTGEEIARAIPYPALFLDAIDEMKSPTFFELSEDGQLVMMDGHPFSTVGFETLGEARKRQTHIVYLGEGGEVRVIEGDSWSTVEALSDAVKEINPDSILMKKGLPTLHQYARMQTIRIERGERYFDGTKIQGALGAPLMKVWTEDASLDPSKAQVATWNWRAGCVESYVADGDTCDKDTSSRGVLSVKLNLEPELQ